MRDRLVELIQNSVNGCAKHWAEVIADHLLANGVIVPPYEIGTKVYVPINSLSLPIPDAIYECEIQRYSLVTGGLAPIIKVKKGSVTYGDIHTSLDKLYATREEAEKALKGGESDG
jgi:hypothetical protein